MSSKEVTSPCPIWDTRATLTPMAAAIWFWPRPSISFVVLARHTRAHLARHSEGSPDRVPHRAAAKQVHPIGPNCRRRPSRRQEIAEEGRGRLRYHPVRIHQTVRLVAIASGEPAAPPN